MICLLPVMLDTSQGAQPTGTVQSQLQQFNCMILYRLYKKMRRVCRYLALAILKLALVEAQAPWDAALITLPPDIQAAFNARCLDGSTPGIYLRKGDPTRVKLHIQGGGWCTSAQDCAGRSQSILGSNATWTPWLSAFWPPEGAGFYGFEDANASNPFGGFTFAWFTYCDGSSFTSDASGPVTVGTTTIWNRGRANLDAYLALLDRETGFFSRATEVIVSGTSAGGLATYLHTGYIKSRLTQQASRVVALPDAGFFLDGKDGGSAQAGGGMYILRRSARRCVRVNR
jgi:O-palmitoleoyl-L-serine hydrolase